MLRSARRASAPLVTARYLSRTSAALIPSFLEGESCFEGSASWPIADTTKQRAITRGTNGGVLICLREHCIPAHTQGTSADWTSGGDNRGGGRRLRGDT